MNFIEKHSKILAIGLCACVCVPVFTTVQAYEMKPGWHGEGADRYYILESNRQEATGLTEIDGDLYYFNDKGDMQFGWQDVSDKTYYFETDGTAVTGETEIQGTIYNFQDEGVLLHGWSEDKKSYYDEQGFKTSESWIEDGGFKYYFDKDGNVVTGWQDLEDSRYYFGQDGKLATGQVDIDGKTYYFGQDGKFTTGWVEKDDQKFYYDENGQQIKNEFKDIDGKKYAFGENGELLKNTEKEGYTIDGEGVATEKVETESVTESEPVKQEQATTASQSTPSQSTTSQSQSQSQSSSTTTTTKPETPSTPAYSGVNSSAIAAAAIAQVGVNQDCTRLVSNSLAAVGINFHGWPASYASLGSYTSNPVPGDIIIYSGHVAIYIGNGQAVHGGWLGSQTVISSVSCSNALIGYVHI